MIPRAKIASKAKETEDRARSSKCEARKASHTASERVMFSAAMKVYPNSQIVTDRTEMSLRCQSVLPRSLKKIHLLKSIIMRLVDLHKFNLAAATKKVRYLN